MEAFRPVIADRLAMENRALPVLPGYFDLSALASRVPTPILPRHGPIWVAEDARSTAGAGNMSLEVNVLALLKGQERYIFVYDDISHRELLETVRDQAADPELSLTWFDVTVLTKKAHEQITATLVAPAGPPDR